MATKRAVLARCGECATCAAPARVAIGMRRCDQRQGGAFMGWFKSTRLAMFGIAASFVVAGSGCAGERDPIDQTQIGALPKQFFVGQNLEDKSDDPEFYFRSTVV